MLKSTRQTCMNAMTQPFNPIELARQRDIKSIANLLNSRTTPLNTTTKVSLKGDVLQLLMESPEDVDRERLIPIVQGFLVKLRIVGVERVRVYGRSIGQDVPEWTSEFEIIETQDLTPPPIVPPKQVQSFRLTGAAESLPKTPHQERISKSNAIGFGISGAIVGVLISLPMIWTAFQMPSILGLGPLYFIGVGVVVAIGYLSGFSQGLKLFDVQCPSCSHTFQLSGDGGECPACRERLFIGDRGDCQRSRSIGRS